MPVAHVAAAMAFLRRAARYLAQVGISRIERVITDNHWSYRNSYDVAAVIADLGAKHKFIKPHCPWQNGKVERFNRTLATEWAYARAFTSNDQRTAALAPWLEHYNNERRHTGYRRSDPIQPSVTNLLARYN